MTGVLIRRKKQYKDRDRKNTMGQQRPRIETLYQSVEGFYS